MFLCRHEYKTDWNENWHAKIVVLKPVEVYSFWDAIPVGPGKFSCMYNDRVGKAKMSMARNLRRGGGHFGAWQEHLDIYRDSERNSAKQEEVNRTRAMFGRSGYPLSGLLS